MGSCFFISALIDEASFARALGLLAAYVAIAVTVATVSFARRDVTT